MDLIKIGKFIAGKRKDLGMTQKQLAEKLGMSDKSVSKWERGVCLPDVSIFSDLCSILGISVNEFLAGEEIKQENMIEKTEENIIGVATESKHKQKRLKAIIGVLLTIAALVILILGVILYQAVIPKNYIAPLPKDAIEMETAELLSGADGIYIYKFVTTDKYKSLKVNIAEYQSGKLIKKEVAAELGFEDIGSPENGRIIVLPDFEKFIVKLIIADEAGKISTELPILTDVPDRRYYARSATEINDALPISYNQEQGLVGLIYDNDELSPVPIQDFIKGESGSLSSDDFAYFFSVEFVK